MRQVQRLVKVGRIQRRIKAAHRPPSVMEKTRVIFKDLYGVFQWLWWYCFLVETIRKIRTSWYMCIPVCVCVCMHIYITLIHKARFEVLTYTLISEMKANTKQEFTWPFKADISWRIVRLRTQTKPWRSRQGEFSEYIKFLQFFSQVHREKDKCNVTLMGGVVGLFFLLMFNVFFRVFSVNVDVNVYYLCFCKCLFLMSWMFILMSNVYFNVKCLSFNVNV